MVFSFSDRAWLILWGMIVLHRDVGLLVDLRLGHAPVLLGSEVEDGIHWLARDVALGGSLHLHLHQVLPIRIH